MFLLKFAKTYDFSIMVKHHLKHVLEDYFEVSGDIFCVADGVTRSRTDGKPFYYPVTLEQALDLIPNYPNPSGATEAAQICVRTFMQEMKNETEVSEKKILKAIKLANKNIKKINTGRKIDYMQEDYYCCVAAGGVIEGETLYCFAICDCQIKLLDKNCHILFDSASQTMKLLSHSHKSTLFFRLFDQKKYTPETIHKYDRKYVRNNTMRRLLGQYAYGALTGESRAIPFVKTFKLPLNNVQYILAHSDGCDDCLQTEEQIIEVIRNPEQIQNELHEKTLIIYERTES